MYMTKESTEVENRKEQYLIILKMCCYMIIQGKM